MTDAEREYDYEVQGLYQGEWEMVTTETTPQEARERLGEYQEAEPGTAFRVKRVKAS